MVQPTVIHLIRHGEVDNPRKLYYGRLPGFYLNNDGRREARVAGEALSTSTLAAVYSSPLSRARETAEIIVGSHDGLHVLFDDRLNEVFSPYDGWKRKDVKKMNFNVFHPNYEEPDDVFDRVQEFVWQMRQEYPEQEVAAVTHGAAILFMFLFAHKAKIAGLKSAKQLKREFGFPTRYFAGGSISTLTYHTMDRSKVPEYRYLDPIKGDIWECELR